MSIRLVLASASPARLRTLRAAGLSPQVVVSGVDEEAEYAPTAAELVLRLARLKAEAVASDRRPPRGGRELIVGCDSLLELDGAGYGKPATAEAAVERWRTMSGRSGVLHTGHHLILRDGADETARSATASTVVHFAELTEAEIAAYVATDEPLAVAGAFTLDGLGGAFVAGIEGDPSNVIGISLPLLRSLVGELGIAWYELWDC